MCKDILGEKEKILMAPKAITISVQASKCSPETHNATIGGRREKKKTYSPQINSTSTFYSISSFFSPGRQTLLYWSEHKRRTAEINSEIGRGTKPIHSEQKWDLNRLPWNWTDEASVVCLLQRRQQQRHTERDFCQECVSIQWLSIGFIERPRADVRPKQNILGSCIVNKSITQ